MKFIRQYLNKNNLHHAYLIEGNKEEILPQLFEFIEELEIDTKNNPDFFNLVIDNFKKEEALFIREMGNQKAFSANSRRIFILSVNRFTFDAQGILLKIFEEPIKDTFFFIITPNFDILLKTFLSRFYLIKHQSVLKEEFEKANSFISMNLNQRILFLKENFTKETEEEKEKNLDSNQTKALKFLDNLEKILSEKVFLLQKDFKVDFFEHIFKVREFLRQPGSSVKTLLESVALVIPVLK